MKIEGKEEKKTTRFLLHKSCILITVAATVLYIKLLTVIKTGFCIGAVSGENQQYAYAKHLSCLRRKPTICICETKGADQLRSNCEADQHLCFRYMDSTIPLLSKSKFLPSSHLLCLCRSVCVRPVRKSHYSFFMMRLICILQNYFEISTDNRFSNFMQIL